MLSPWLARRVNEILRLTTILISGKAWLIKCYYNLASHPDLSLVENLIVIRSQNQTLMTSIRCSYERGNTSLASKLPRARSLAARNRVCAASSATGSPTDSATWSITSCTTSMELLSHMLANVATRSIHEHLTATGTKKSPPACLRQTLPKIYNYRGSQRSQSQKYE